MRDGKAVGHLRGIDPLRFRCDPLRKAVPIVISRCLDTSDRFVLCCDKIRVVDRSRRADVNDVVLVQLPELVDNEHQRPQIGHEVMNGDREHGFGIGLPKDEKSDRRLVSEIERLCVVHPQPVHDLLRRPVCGLDELERGLWIRMDRLPWRAVDVVEAGAEDRIQLHELSDRTLESFEVQSRCDPECPRDVVPQRRRRQLLVEPHPPLHLRHGHRGTGRGPIECLAVGAIHR